MLPTKAWSSPSFHRVGLGLDPELCKTLLTPVPQSGQLTLESILSRLLHCLHTCSLPPGTLCRKSSGIWSTTTVSVDPKLSPVTGKESCQRAGIKHSMFSSRAQSTQKFPYTVSINTSGICAGELPSGIHHWSTASSACSGLVLREGKMLLSLKVTHSPITFYKSGILV